MKMVILFFGLLTSVTAMADSLELQCRDTQNNIKYSIKIESSSSLYIGEDTPVAAELTILRLKKPGQEVLVLPRKHLGSFEYQDVYNRFSANDGSLFFDFYADELEYSSMSINVNGKWITTDLDCRGDLP